jgi:hypothetical protein
MGVHVTARRCLTVFVLLILAHVNARLNVRAHDTGRRWASQASENATELAARDANGANVVFSSSPAALGVGVQLAEMLSAFSMADPQHGFTEVSVGPIQSNSTRFLTETSAVATTTTSAMLDSEHPFADTASSRLFFNLLNSTLSYVAQSPMYLMQVRFINIDA